MKNGALMVEEIVRLTRQELATTSGTDSIRECGRAALLLLPVDPATCQELAYQKLHDVPYNEVKTCWRRLYTDASLWKVVESAEAQGKSLEQGANEEDLGGWVDDVVTTLDMALILTGAAGREEVVELWFSALKTFLSTDHTIQPSQNLNDLDRSAKRQKIWHPNTPSSSFPTTLPVLPPTLRYPIPRTQVLSMSAFQDKVSNTSTHTPMIIEGAIEHWPALDERPWSCPEYLLEQTLGGRRLVPVEIGKSYTDESWGQKIITFASFMDTYMLNSHGSATKGISGLNQTGYLAQHDLFAQIPSLRADISIPDYCYCDPLASSLAHIKPTTKLEQPLLNAWFGPAGTISPLHTDPYHNILAQVVGYKYIRLYAPEETAKLYPRDIDEKGVDMSNTSQVDLDEAMRVWNEISCLNHEADCDQQVLEQHKKDYEEQFKQFKDAAYIEGILGPGESLYLPVGWWHYVRSLTPSFSVSFWFN
ncbi:jumonji domain-containing 5 [Phaeosphaeriaceae sp. PMI808]|nr:jumonji domain-containing 5 [Phaeosphaeriaceae sp. PMI808]